MEDFEHVGPQTPMGGMSFRLPGCSVISSHNSSVRCAEKSRFALAPRTFPPKTREFCHAVWGCGEAWHGPVLGCVLSAPAGGGFVGFVPSTAAMLLWRMHERANACPVDNQTWIHQLPSPGNGIPESRRALWHPCDAFIAS